MLQHICYSGQLHQKPGFSYIGIGIGSKHLLFIDCSIAIVRLMQVEYRQSTSLIYITSIIGITFYKKQIIYF